MNQRPKVKPKATKHLEENKGEDLCDLVLDTQNNFMKEK